MLWKHNLDPILVSFGPIQVRWYGFMYLVGFVMGFGLFARRHRRGLFAPNPEEASNLITYIMLGMMFCARLFYVAVYNPKYYMENPTEIPQIWHGGLSFHGAALGFIIAVILFGRHNKYSFYQIMDSVVIGSAQGIFWGRLGNFINGELPGRVTDGTWGIIFPEGGIMPRHPSQLYQAFGEGLSVFVLLHLIQWWEQRKGNIPQALPVEGCVAGMERSFRNRGQGALAMVKWVLWTPYNLYMAFFFPERISPAGGPKKPKSQKMEWKRPGVLSTWFLILYGVARFVVEFFREPDSQLGYYFGWMTMGQILCLIMIVVGFILLALVIRKPQPVTYEA